MRRYMAYEAAKEEAEDRAEKAEQKVFPLILHIFANVLKTNNHWQAIGGRLPLKDNWIDKQQFAKENPTIIVILQNIMVYRIIW